MRTFTSKSRPCWAHEETGPLGAVPEEPALGSLVASGWS